MSPRWFLFLIPVVAAVYFLRSQLDSPDPGPPTRKDREMPALAEGQVGIQTISVRPSDRARLMDLWAEKDYDQAASVFATWIESHPEAALRFIDELRPPVIPEHFAPAIQRDLEARSPEEALQLAETLASQHELQLTVTKDLVSGWAQAKPREALDWLVSGKDDPWREGLAFHLGIHGRLGAEAEALDTIATLPAGPVRSKLVSAVMIRWIHDHPEHAIAHLNNSPASADFDDCLAFYARLQQARFRAEARAWAENITAEGIRSMFLQEVREEWTDEDERIYQQLEK